VLTEIDWSPDLHIQNCRRHFAKEVHAPVVDVYFQCVGDLKDLSDTGRHYKLLEHIHLLHRSFCLVLGLLLFEICFESLKIFGVHEGHFYLDLPRFA
jgi:hypothetical protein